MTPDQIEVLKPGYEVHTFRVQVNPDPPYGIKATVTKGRVLAITKGKGKTNVHVLPFDAPDDATDSTMYSPGEVYTSGVAAARGCLDCLSGVSDGLKDLRTQFRDLAKTERDAAKAANPRRKKRKDNADPAGESAAPEATASEAVTPLADATADLPGERPWIDADTGAAEDHPEPAPDHPRAGARRNGRRRKDAAAAHEVAPEEESREIPESEPVAAGVE